jgi:hypothetical protein
MACPSYVHVGALAQDSATTVADIFPLATALRAASVRLDEPGGHCGQCCSRVVWRWRCCCNAVVVGGVGVGVSRDGGGDEEFVYVYVCVCVCVFVRIHISRVCAWFVHRSSARMMRVTHCARACSRRAKCGQPGVAALRGCSPDHADRV